MVYAVGFLSIAAFVAAMRVFDLAPIAMRAVSTTRDSARWMRDPALDDTEKERKLRAASVALFGTFFSILVRGALAVGASLVPMVLAEFSGVAAFGEVTAFLLTWQAIALASAVLIAAYFVGARS